MSAATVEFIENHVPALPAGEYTLTIEQSLTGDQKPLETYRQTKTFYVASDRYRLPLQMLHSIYPPENSSGEYETVLPHIVLNRSTLPWERKSDQNDAVPWLALLLFHEEDHLDDIQTLTLEAIRNDPTLKFTIARLPNEIQDQNQEKIAILKLPETLRSNLIPTPESLKLLTHVRKVNDSKDTELAVIVGDRLPTVGRNVVHLVSLENYFHPVSAATSTYQYLISLKSWEFNCEVGNSKNRFQELLKQLNHNEVNSPKPNNTLRRSPVDHPIADDYLSQGYVPLPHHLRNSQQTISWYRGPLIPGRNLAPLEQLTKQLPLHTSDQLLRYFPEIQMFDVSQSAAYELGQLLALQDKTFSLDLYNWKRQIQRQQSANVSKLAILFDHISTSIDDNGEIPASIKAWFDASWLLKQIPFNYLVPAPSLLPEESMRFFYVDPEWLNCFSAGAFGLGNSLSMTDKQKLDYRKDQQKALTNNPNRTTTGFLLRSRLLIEFPALKVKGLNASNTVCPLLRLENLSDTVLIVLFDGEVESVEISAGAEILHFGLEGSIDRLGKKVRNLTQPRSTSATPIQSLFIQLTLTVWKVQTQRILDIPKLAQEILKRDSSKSRQVNSSEFAFMMVEGSPKLIFRRSS